MELDTEFLVHLRPHLLNALQGHERAQSSGSGRLSFGEFPDFVLTPDKSYSAKTVVPVLYNGEEVTTMSAILFQPYDGTGDTSTFSLGSLAVPKQWQHDTKPERVLPRAKTGILYEGCFPLFGLKPGLMPLEYIVRPFAISLDELIVDSPDSPTAIVKGWDLGISNENYQILLGSELSLGARVFLTTGTTRGGQRFGDPHVVYNGRNSIQVAGFVGIRDNDNPLINLVANWETPESYK